MADVIAAVACAAVVVLAAALWWTVRRGARGARVLERERDDAVDARDSATLAVERLQRATDALPLGVLLCDENRTVVYRNRAATAYASGRAAEAMVTAAIEDLLDAALAGVPGRRSLDQYGPPRRTLVLSAWPLDRETVDRESADVERGDGTAETHIIGAVVLVNDVSERRRLEAVRRDFVANISHELKTPVGALSLLAETMLDERDPDVVGRLAERILSEALRVGRTIDDLLELSRIEIDEAPEHEAVGVATVVAKAVERIRPAAEQSGIALTSAPVADDVVVLGDPRQLVSALYNLLDNAVKYSDPGAGVAVTTDVTDETVTIAVADHGIGIPARDVDRIFERFYRVDRARSRDTGGTGLGLAIVRHVAANHDGDVRVESRQGEGSTFTLTLPRHHAVAARTPG